MITLAQNTFDTPASRGMITLITLRGYFSDHLGYSRYIRSYSLSHMKAIIDHLLFVGQDDHDQLLFSWGCKSSEGGFRC